jgi:hypothetical protein
MNSLDQRNRILHEIKLVVLGARFEVTKVKFKMLIWPDGNYLIHRPLPLEVMALKTANRYAGVL